MSNKTVYVIGAGASSEVKLPTGAELKGKIADLLNIQFDIIKQQRGDRVIGDINPYLHEAWHICKALPLAISIDNFIDAHKNNEKLEICGKLGIVQSILNAERNSLLFINDSGLKISSLSDTWYLPFFRSITENCTVEDLKSRFSSISLIIFNYDRCAEHFLSNAIQIYFKISEDQASEILGSLCVYHPYGSVGALPWMKKGPSIPFGEKAKPQQLVELLKMIRTFTEGTSPESSNISEIRESMSSANRIAFLGFAFHELNLQLLSSKQKYENKSIVHYFASSFGISDSDKDLIKRKIKSMYKISPRDHMVNSKCKDFFNEFWKGLAFSSDS